MMSLSVIFYLRHIIITFFANNYLLIQELLLNRVAVNNWFQHYEIAIRSPKREDARDEDVFPNFLQFNSSPR